MKNTDKEKRKFPRAIFPCKIVVDSPRRQITSQTENIGKGGIRINLDQELAPSSIVGLRLFLRGEKPIRCEGKVKWVMRKENPMVGKCPLFYTGVEFTTISDSNKDSINKIVDTLLTENDNARKNNNS